MAVIWGLDLHDVQWYKFKSSYMFGNTDYHLRRTKFIIYQCSMIFLVVSESLGTAVLSDYLDQQSSLQGQFPHIDIFNNDFIGIASFNIFVGVFAAIVFGAGFFFDLFFPDRYEPRWVQWMWLGSAIFCSVAGFGDTIAYTIILATHGQKISNYDLDDPQLIQQLTDTHGKTPVTYSKSGRAVASVVFLWVGWVCAVASTFVMYRFYNYYNSHGTAKAAHIRDKEDIKGEAGDLSLNEISAPLDHHSQSQTEMEGANPGHSNPYVISNQKQTD